MSNIKVVDVIIRKTAEKTKLTGEGNLSVSISSPSVIEIRVLLRMWCDMSAVKTSSFI